MKLILSTLIVVLTMLVCVPSLAQDPIKDPADAPGVAAPVVAVPAVSPEPPKVVSTLQGVSNKIPSSLPTWLIVLLGAAVELIMRVWPSVKPRSVFILVGSIFSLIGGIFMKISGLLDVVVQNIKDPAS